MTDRVPGAPGQYSAVISKEALQKMQDGEAFAITLTRDDQPIKEGTPYSKAAVLPDAVAAVVCPGVEDPAPKDAFAALQEKKADTIQQRSGSVITAGDSAYTPVKGLKLYGKTTQAGTPTEDTPIDLVSAGDSGSVNVTVYGKNLIPYPYYDTSKTENGITFTDNGDGSVTMNGTATNTAGFYLLSSTTSTIPVYKGVTYTANVPTGCRLMGYDLEKGTYPVLSSGGSAATMKYSYNLNHIYIQVLTGTTLDNVTVFPQFEAGTAATEYEPYKEPQTLTVSTPNGLCGIPVSSGGNYTDSTGQQWICDEIDFARGVYVQRIGNVRFDGSEDWKQNNGWLSGWTNYFAIRLENNSLGTGVQAVNSLCSHYRPYGGNINGSMTTNYGWFCFNTSISSVADWKAMLAQQSAAGTPVTVVYALVTSIETALSTEELAAYAKLHTYSPTTTVFNDSGADMELTYYTPTTAVQMVHSPEDAGKTFTIDEHGCVTLIHDNPVIACGLTTIDGTEWYYRKWADGFAECWARVYYDGSWDSRVAIYRALPFGIDARGFDYVKAYVSLDNDIGYDPPPNFGSIYESDYYTVEIIVNFPYDPGDETISISGNVYLTGWWKTPEVTGS